VNKVYRVIFNEVTRTWTAVCETARSRGKSSTTLQKLVRIAQALGLSAFLTAKLYAAEPPPTALPSGGQVAAGVAQLLQGGTAQAPVLNIDQSTQRAVINWGTFNVGAAATVNFNRFYNDEYFLTNIGNYYVLALYADLAGNDRFLCGASLKSVGVTANENDLVKEGVQFEVHGALDFAAS
jgi:hypothetical protein